MNAGDISERLALRQKLKCKGFHWYLKNVFPESMMLVGYKAIGQVTHFLKQVFKFKFSKNKFVY